MPLPPPPEPPEGWGQAASEAAGLGELGAGAADGGGAGISPDGWDLSEGEEQLGAVAAVPDGWPTIQDALQASPPKKRAKGRPKKAALAKATAASGSGGGSGEVVLPGPVSLVPVSHRAIVPSSSLHRSARGVWALPDSALARLRRPRRVGEAHPLAAALQTLSGSLTPGGPVDEEARSVAATLLGGSTSLPMVSGVGRAGMAGMTSFRLATREQTAMTAALVASKSARWELEEGMAMPRSGLKCLLYLDNNRYDETPMRVKAPGGSSTAAGAASGQEAGSGNLHAGAVALAPLSGSVAPWTPDVGEAAVTIADHGKLLQTESGYGMLLSINGKHCLVRGSTLTHLLNLEACSARCLVAAQRLTSSISPACSKFRLRLRTSTTDRASANLLCERVMSTTLEGAEFKGLHLGCDVHVVSRIHTRVMSLADPTVVGVLRHALSLQGGLHMNLFRKALRLEIRSRGGVVVRVGSAPREALQHRELMLRLFASHGRSVLPRRVLLMLLPNGDWRSRRIEVFVDDVSQLSAAEAERQLANGLVAALAGSTFQVYPRHRWTGADVAFDRCGLLEAVHGLGAGAYRHFLRLLGEAGAGRSGAPAAAELLALEDAAVADARPADADAGFGRLASDYKTFVCDCVRCDTCRFVNMRFLFDPIQNARLSNLF